MDLTPDTFPKDVIARAKELLGEIGSIGAYSQSQGVPIIRENVAKFIEGELIKFSIHNYMHRTKLPGFDQNEMGILLTRTIFSSPRVLQLV
jgi:hypothetical protein